MSFETNVENAFIRAGTEVKALRTLINGNLADLSGLTTAAKTNLVAAINELAASITTLEAGSAGIDDGATATDSTWSSQKVSDQLAAVRDEILGGAGTAYDTLEELKGLLDALGSDEDSLQAAVTAGLGNRLRIDAAQGLTAPQKQQGRDNLDVYSKAEIGDVTTNLVTVFEGALV